MLNPTGKNKNGDEKENISKEIERLEILEKELEEKEKELEEKIKSSNKKEGVNNVSLDDLMFSKKEKVSDKPKIDQKNKFNNKRNETKPRNGIEIPQKQIEDTKTFEKDSKKVLDNKKTSLTKIAIEEKEREKEKGYKNPYYEKDIKEDSNKNNKLKISIITLIILIITGIAILFFVNIDKFRGSTEDTETEVERVPQVGSAEKIILSSLEKLELEEKIEEMKNSLNISNNEITLIEIIKENSGEILNSKEFLQILETNDPNYFKRSIENNFILGIYREDDVNYVFLVLRVTSFENAFAGMFDWEKSITNDLGKIFLTEELESNNFKDIVLRNRDIRVSEENNLGEKIVYSFLNRNFLVISSNENIFDEIMNRFLR